MKTIIYPPKSFMDAPSLGDIQKANDKGLVEKYSYIEKGEELHLGSYLDDVTVSRGGRWQIKNYIARKEEQKVKREVNKRNKNIRRFMYLIIVMLGLLAFIFFLFLVYKLVNRIS